MNDVGLKFVSRLFQMTSADIANVTLTLMVFDKQSNDRRIKVES